MTDSLFDNMDLTPEELNLLERLANEADYQRVVGGKDWPGRPSRQRLDLFLATSPQVVRKLVHLARKGLKADA